MSEFNAGEAVDQVSGSLTRFSESLNVIGEPVTVGEKVVIPAVIARAGFGAGGGSGTGPTKEGEPVAKGSGGGGGGGLMLTPIFLVVDAEGERLLTVPGAADVATTAVERVKDTVTSFFTRGKKEEAEQEAEDEG
ncbi:MAG: spore germination protein GerW family protein [Armatimonadota bacterium]|jgi:uncharacterized spore protein YtfJ